MKRKDRKFRNLKYRYKITLLVLGAGILPVVIMAVYFLRGMIVNIQSQEMDNMEKVIEQSVNTMTNQANIYENLVDYLSYSRELRDIVTMEPQPFLGGIYWFMLADTALSDTTPQKSMGNHFLKTVFDQNTTDLNDSGDLQIPYVYICNSHCSSGLEGWGGNEESSSKAFSFSTAVVS